MEYYMTLVTLVTVLIDMQFKLDATNAGPNVLGQQNEQLKEALGMLNYLKKMCANVCIYADDVKETALELRSETLDNLSYVVKGIYYINCVDRAIAMNKEADKADEAPKYSPDILSGLARGAESAFKNAMSQLETCFTKDIKKINPNYINFIKSMYLVAKMYKAGMAYKHWYEIANDLSASTAQVEEAEKQKKLLGSEMKESIAKFEAIRIKATGVDEWFANRFEPSFNEF